MFAIKNRWPSKHPERIQLYSLNTPNGIKVALALEEMQLAYEAHTVDITQGDQHTAEYKALNFNNKIPSIIDPNGPDNQPIALTESVVILDYLADKTANFKPTSLREQLECRQWLTFQAAHLGPMFGQFGHFYMYAKEQCKDPYPMERYRKESQRLLGILDQRLSQQAYLLNCGYSIVDMACLPWVDCLEGHYQAGDILDLPSYKHVSRWLTACKQRPAYLRARDVCAL